MTIDITWQFHKESYCSPNRPVGPLSRTFPSLAFYARATRIVLRSSAMARGKATMAGYRVGYLRA